MLNQLPWSVLSWFVYRWRIWDFSYFTSVWGCENRPSIICNHKNYSDVIISYQEMINNTQQIKSELQRWNDALVKELNCCCNNGSTAGLSGANCNSLTWLTVLLVDLGDVGAIWLPGSVGCLTGRAGKVDLVGIRLDGAILKPAELVAGDDGHCCEGCWVVCT